MNTAVAAYRQNTIDTASPGQLVVMLNRGVLHALDLTEAALDGPVKDLDRAHRELTRAQGIVLELLQTLDMSAQPVADSLASLYQYSMACLVEANVSKTFRPVEPVRRVFQDITEAWATVVNGDPA